MAYKALYRKWRPLTFDEVVGQEHVTKTLKNEIELGRIGHAYLFCGSRGTGKTSTARILSRAINCLNRKDGNPCNECENCKGILDGSILDITEIDAASNNGVDNIRDLREEARFSGSKLSTRVYIVDEVHMLTTNAFNALLKILEEPPAHVRFILATTEAHKVPATILSRCQRFDFKRINTSDLEKQLKKIIESDGFVAEERGIRLIAEKADGSMRDALSILDQCMAIGNCSLSYNDISSFLGATENEYLFRLSNAIAENDAVGAIKVISDYVDAGKNTPQLIEDFIKFMRNILMCKFIENPTQLLDISESDAEDLIAIAKLFSQEKLIHIIKLSSEALNMARYSLNARVLFEIAIIKMIKPIYDASIDGFASRLSELEAMIKSGNFQSNKKIEKQKPTPKATESAPVLVNSELVNKVKRVWNDILGDLFERNRLQIALALENAIISDQKGKLAVLYESQDELSACKQLLHDEQLEDFKNTIAKFAGISPEIYIGAAEMQSNDNKNDNLAKLIKNLE